MNQSLEKRWNFNSRVKKTKQRKNFSTFFSIEEKSLEAKAQAAALHKQYEILSKSARKRAPRGSHSHTVFLENVYGKKNASSN